MKESIDRTFRSLTTFSDEDVIRALSAGFLAGIALSKLDPLLAATVDRLCRAEWGLSDERGGPYGPGEMAKTLVARLAAE